MAGYEGLAEGGEKAAIGAVFGPIECIALASPEVEQLINLFVASFAEGEEEEPPMQRNLDKTTLKFLLKTDLYRTVQH